MKINFYDFLQYRTHSKTFQFHNFKAPALLQGLFFGLWMRYLSSDWYPAFIQFLEFCSASSKWNPEVQYCDTSAERQHSYWEPVYGEAIVNIQVGKCVWGDYNPKHITFCIRQKFWWVFWLKCSWSSNCKAYTQQKQLCK